MTGKPIDDNPAMVFDPKAVSILQAIFNPVNPPVPEEVQAKKASVKFMITSQDEEELRILGYSRAQIHRIKPQEAAEILQAGRKA